MLGDDVLGTWRVMDHDARDHASLVDLGMVGDVPVCLAPGMGRGGPADHHRASSSRTSSPGSAAGRRWSRRASPASRRPSSCTTRGGSATHGRPGASSRATRSTMPSGRSPRRRGVDFALDVLLDDEQRITRAFGGEILAMHAAACAAARREAMRAVDAPFDIVITTNSGYPLDQNLYQAVKGMSAAAEIVRTGRHDHLRRGVSGRAPGPRLVRAAPPRGPVARRPARAHRRLARDRSRINGRSRSRPASRRRREVLLRCDGLSDDRGPGRAPRTDPRHRGGRRAPARRRPDGSDRRAAAGAADDRLRGLTRRRDRPGRGVGQAIHPATATASVVRGRLGTPASSSRARRAGPHRSPRVNASSGPERRPGGGPRLGVVMADHPAPPGHVGCGSPARACSKSSSAAISPSAPTITLIGAKSP